MKKVLLCMAIGILFAGVVSADPSNGQVNPGNSGVIRITHFDFDVWCVLALDLKTSLMSVHAFSDSFCGCQEFAENLPFVEQDIYITDEILNLLFRSPSHHAHVYDYPDYTGGPLLDCDILLNKTGQLVATGTAKGVIHYSGITLDFLESGRGATTWNWQLHGKLFNVLDGEGTVNLNTKVHWTIRPDGQVLPKKEVVRVLLSPDPR